MHINLDILNNSSNAGNNKRKRENDEKTEQQPKKKRNKNNKNKNNGPQQKQKLDVNKELAMSDVRLEHYGLNAKQFKRKVRKQIYHKKQNTC